MEARGLIALDEKYLKDHKSSKKKFSYSPFHDLHDGKRIVASGIFFHGMFSELSHSSDIVNEVRNL